MSAGVARAEKEERQNHVGGVRLLKLKNVHFIKWSKCGTDFTIVFLSSRWSKNIYGTSNLESE
jgi:hypothetical protein